MISNVFSKNLGTFNYLMYTVHKIYFEGRLLYKIRRAGPLCGAATRQQRGGMAIGELYSGPFINFIKLGSTTTAFQTKSRLNKTRKTSL